MRIFLAICLCTPLMANAGGLACHFVTECIESEACADSDYDFEVSWKSERHEVITVITPSETTGGRIERREGDATTVVAEGDNAMHLLTVSPDGEARYSVHIFDGPMSISSLGRCEEAM